MAARPTFEFSTWLASIGFERFEPKFVEEEITTPRTLSEMNEQNLIALGLTLGGSKKFIRESKKLVENSPSPPTSMPSLPVNSTSTATPTFTHTISSSPPISIPRIDDDMRLCANLSYSSGNSQPNSPVLNSPVRLRYKQIKIKNGETKFHINVDETSSWEEVLEKVSTKLNVNRFAVELFNERTNEKILEVDSLSSKVVVQLKVQDETPPSFSLSSSNIPLAGIKWKLVTNEQLNLLGSQGWSTVSQVLESSPKDVDTIKAIFDADTAAFNEFMDTVESFRRTENKRLDEWEAEDVIKWAEEKDLFDRTTAEKAKEVIRLKKINGFDLFYKPPVEPRFFMDECPLKTKPARNSLRSKYLIEFAPEKAALTKNISPLDVLKRHQLIEVPFPANVDSNNHFEAPRPELNIENFERWDYISDREKGSLALGFVGATGSGKSFIINEFLDRNSRLNGDTPPAAADVQQGIPTTPNMQLYFGQLLDGSPVHLIDCEGGDGGAPKYILESQQRFDLLKAIKSVLVGHYTDDQCKVLEREADSLRLKVVNEFFPALVYSYCDVLIYVGSIASANQKWLDSAIQFADVCAQGTRSNCMPALILIKNQSPWPNKESERLNYLDIEATSNTFIAAREIDTFGLTAEKIAKLKTFYSSVKYVFLPNRDAYPEDYAIQINNLKQTIASLSSGSQLCQSLTEKTRFQLLEALVKQWNTHNYQAQPSLDTADAYWSIFNSTENKRERAFQVMRMVYSSLRPAPPPERAWYLQYTPNFLNQSESYRQKLATWQKENLRAYHRAYHVGMILSAGAQSRNQEVRKTPSSPSLSGGLLDATLDRIFNELHTLFTQLRPCQSINQNFVCIASSFPSHNRHRCYGETWPDYDVELEYVQDKTLLDKDWQGEHSCLWWKKKVLEFSRTTPWQKGILEVLDNINREIDWKNDTLPFCVICLEAGGDIMLSCGHSSCKECAAALGGDLVKCALCPANEPTREVVADDSQRLPKGAGIRILSLDGGGTRGIILQIVLLELRRRLMDKFRINLRETFDFVGGTSIGAVVGSVFAKTNDGITSDRITRELLPRVFNNLIARTAGIVTYHMLTVFKAPYSGALIQEFINNEVGKKLLFRSDLRSNGPKLAIFATKKSVNDYGPVAFTDFVLPLSQKLRRNNITCPFVVTVGEAVQASCSAPGYFSPMKIRGEEYFDGGLVANNPCEHTIRLAKKLWPKRKIDCIVSIGTGSLEKSTSDNQQKPLIWLLNVLIQKACDVDTVSNKIKERYPSNSFRLNPILETQFPLDTNDKSSLSSLDLQTQAYLKKPATEKMLNQIIRRLVASSFYLVPLPQDSNDDVVKLKIVSRIKDLNPNKFVFKTSTRPKAQTLIRDFEVEITGTTQQNYSIFVDVCVDGEYVPISGCPFELNKGNIYLELHHEVPKRWRRLASMLDRRVLSDPYKLCRADYNNLVERLKDISNWRREKIVDLPNDLSRTEEDLIAQQLYRGEDQEVERVVRTVDYQNSSTPIVPNRTSEQYHLRP